MVQGVDIRLRDVHLSLKSIAGEVHILRGVQAQVQAGERVAVTGPSGAGKSSLLLLLAGLERPSSGEVLLDGRDIAGLGEDELAKLRGRDMGIVFQAFHLSPTMTALENAALPLELQGRADAFDLAAETLRQVGLGHRLDHFPGQLSGGEQQRVALARAFAPKPRLILADEPTGNLDQATGQAVMDLLFSQVAKQRATLVLITHDKELARRCDREMHLRDGLLEHQETEVFFR